MSKVFVVDSYYRPLNPVHPGWARLLLRQGKASVYRRFPFTIILKVAVDQPQVEPLRLKIDPGSQTSGIAVVNDASGEVVFAANLEHRGQEIKQRIESRRAVRVGKEYQAFTHHGLWAWVQANVSHDRCWFPANETQSKAFST